MQIGRSALFPGGAAMAVLHSAAGPKQVARSALSLLGLSPWQRANTARRKNMQLTSTAPRADYTNAVRTLVSDAP